MKLISINNIDYEIVVVGMGYVGLTYSLYFNKLGYAVTGIDNNVDLNEKINSKKLPFYEKGLEKSLNRFISNNMIIVQSPDEFKSKVSDRAKIYIITVGTPIENNKINKNSLDNVFFFLQNIIQENDAISLRSTVALGYTRKYCEKINKNLKYCFAPERTIEGKAIEELSILPQVFGANDINSKSFFKEFYSKVSKEIFEVSSTESAELVKLTSNVYRDVIFGFSNEISLISHKNNINSSEVIAACNYNYPRCNIYSSGPVGGPCLSKDSYILAESIDEKNTKSLILTARKLNENYAIEVLGSLISNAKNACILGLSFKGDPPTNDIRDSYALQIVDFLKSKNITVSAYDPMVFEEDFKNLCLKRDKTLEDAFKNKDLIIIQNNNEIFRRMNIDKLSELTNNGSIILDLWSMFNKVNVVKSKYISL
tara:strand:+ start:323 stop:1600 length:1278 start_codon:yes stop_codon:yes gene_type:complete